MYAKIINPKTNGKKVYDNSGSSRRCANYLVKEAKEYGEEARFFGAPDSGYRTADEVVDLLDSNVKGMGKNSPKFHSLVLSPGTDELILIGNNPKSLESYTRNAMDLYAKNFNLKNGQKLGEQNLVWAAIIHQERKNRGTDEGAQGEKKDGLQTHIHIMVSVRDADQKTTLNPLGRADRFNRVQFHAEANIQMEVQFGRVVPLAITAKEPTRRERVAEKMEEITSKAAANRRERKPLTPEQMAAKDVRLDVQVARLNSKLMAHEQLDPARVKDIAKVRKYDSIFYNRLGRMEQNAVKGKDTPEPYSYLTTGRVAREPQLEMGQSLDISKMICVIPPRREKEWEQSAGIQALQRIVDRLSSELAAKSRTQDVRSSREKAQERVREQNREIEM